MIGIKFKRALSDPTVSSKCPFKPLIVSMFVFLKLRRRFSVFRFTHFLADYIQETLILEVTK